MNVKDVDFRFSDGTKVLEAVSLRINSGEKIALVGKSGCGKTTLLRLLAGLLKPISGEIERISSDGFEWTRLGFVFQSWELLPWRNVRQNVALPLELTKDIDKSEYDIRIEQALELVDISCLKSRMPAELSGGQKARAGIARAIVANPCFIFLDEPLGSLDYFTRQKLLKKLNRLMEEIDATSVLVTHNIEEAIDYADRVLVMAKHPSTIIGEVLTSDLNELDADSSESFRSKRQGCIDSIKNLIDA